MKTFAVASLIALASVASAQLDNIPSCALTCFLGPLRSDGCTELTDFACHCKKGAQLISQVQPCVQKACSAADQATAISAVQATCQAAGVPIEIPDVSSIVSSVAASASGVSSVAASATYAASSAAASASAVVSQASSAVESAASSLSSVLASAISSAAASASASSSAAATGTGTADSTSSVTASASASQFTGGAAQATQAVGILGAAALALLAL